MKNAMEVSHKIAELIDGKEDIKVVACNNGTKSCNTRIVRVGDKVYLMTIQGF
jgi:hypothetical protein